MVNLMMNKFLTEEQRKQAYSDYCNGFTFKSNCELSEPVIVTTEFNLSDKTDMLMQAVAQFTAMWMIQIFPLLNGFSGMGSVQFKFKKD